MITNYFAVHIISCYGRHINLIIAADTFDDMLEKITHPSFSYKNKEHIKQLAEFSHKRLKGFGDDGQGNELESLKFVLREFIDIDELKNRIQDLRHNINYYESNNVSFSKGPKINFNDEEGVYTSLAKRIYFTRNSFCVFV